MYNVLADTLDTVLGRRNEFVPSRRQLCRNFIGGADYEEVGAEFFRYFVELGGLQPHHRVLDIGCGFGRMAVPLTRYLSGDGSYEGFDIAPAGVVWCQRRITRRHPNFQFQLLEAHNPLYNPKSTSDAAQRRFPYADGSFDFAIATSVFTHMFPSEIRQYLAEMARVLAPSGTCLVTHFLLNPDARSSMEQGLGRIAFQDTGQGFWAMNATNPAMAVAYDETVMLEQVSRAGLKIVAPVHYGTWSGRPDGLSLQDLVIARRDPGTDRSDEVVPTQDGRDG